ncbi:hypothetical protein [Actinophytocola sp.]|uniref:hypothetical protein n=1 Tax=Actinophytocola sp. TaxID=1872138 RepID=UPI002D7F2E6A|nr:hypothetical protein [Actinophytocola sp.]HET9144185.1 hypothetical protein [Actinophytocola sp.]
MSRNGKMRRQTPRRAPKVLLAEFEANARKAVRMRVAATMKRYARLNAHGAPERCVGFRSGSKIIFDTPERAEACRQSLVARGLSQTRSVHACDRWGGETHYHLTRRERPAEGD